MAVITKYYSGIFHAQFETRKAKPVFALMSTADIDLQPRFALTDLAEITKEQYEVNTSDPQGAFLHRKLSAPVELFFSANNVSSHLLKEVTLFWTQEELNKQQIWTFLAEKDKKKHGRLKARGVIAIEKEIDESLTKLDKPELQPLPTPVTPTLIANVPVESTTPINTLQTKLPIAPITPLQSRPGCFSLPGFNGGLGLSKPIPQGCLRGGCALLFLIPLLFAILGLMRQCGADTQPGATPPVVTHDTVYVERIKERVDTLTLFKTDTIQMVDSSKQTIYKPVTLPNVQFYTNSANLIPTSLSDIQQLGQHLIDSPELNAIVIGHTDNIGDSKKNLDLSKRRAEAVRNVIVSMGVEPNRISAVGKGDTEPKADNSQEEGRMMNRRVEVQLLQQKNGQKEVLNQQ